MDFSPGYTLTDNWIRRLAILDWITDNGGSNPATFVSLGPLFEDTGDIGRQQALAFELRDFQNRGWLRLDEALAFGGWSSTMTPVGIDVVDDVRRHRGDAVSRRKAARDALLRWLYDQKAAGRTSPVLSEISSSPYGFYYGDQFPAEEIERASGWLKDRGYLKGQGSMGAAGPLRPSITSQGEDLVEAGHTASESSPSSPAVDAPLAVAAHPIASTVVHVTGSNNVIQAGSPGATQSASVTQEHRQQVLAVADVLEQALPGLLLNGDQQREVEATVVELRAAAQQSTPEVGRIRASLSRAGDAALMSTATGLGTMISGYIQQALDGLPLV